MPPAWAWDDTKPGPQMAAVMVLEKPTGGTTRVSGGHCRQDAKALLPLPPAMTPEQAAVIEAAERQEHAYAACHEALPAIKATNAAVRALRASRQPRDPVADLLTAAKCMSLDGGNSRERLANLRDAIVALEHHRAAIAALSERGT